MDRRLLGGMLKDWGLALLVVLVILVGWNLVRPGPASSGPAPVFELPNLDGELVRLEDARGRVAVVNFWATWCGPCRAEIPDLSAFHDANPDVLLVGITEERRTAAQLRAFSRQHGVTYPVLQDKDGSIFRAYGVRSIPVTVIVDAEGEIRSVYVGAISKRRLEQAVARARS